MYTKATILNKLNRNDSVTGLDVWYKTFIANIVYTSTTERSVLGTTVSVGEVITILIPFDDKYMDYQEWKSSEIKDNHYSMSPGDLIILDTYIEDDVTPNSINKIKESYGKKVCEVRSVKEVIKRPGINYRLRIEAI